MRDSGVNSPLKEHIREPTITLESLLYLVQSEYSSHVEEKQRWFREKPQEINDIRGVSNK